MSRRGDPRRRRRWPWFLLCLALILVLIFYGGGGLYFSDVLDERGLDAVSRRADTATLEPDVEVVEVDTSAEGDTDLVLRATTATPAELLARRGRRVCGGTAATAGSTR